MTEAEGPLEAPPTDQEILAADKVLERAITHACLQHDRADLFEPLMDDLEGIVQFVAHVGSPECIEGED